MRNPLAGILIPGALALACAAALVLWTHVGPMVDQLEARVPGLDRPKLTEDAAAQAKPLKGTLTPLGGQPAESARQLAAVPRRAVRRHRRAGRAAGPAVARRRPKTLWSIELGEGHAGAAVLAAGCYVLDYDRRPADAVAASRWPTAGRFGGSATRWT